MENTQPPQPASAASSASARRPEPGSPRADAGQALRYASDTAREFLAFKLGDEEYGIDILKVQEIRGYETPTRMANVPAFIKGVVNLRGIIVPIIDLRITFNLDSVEYNEFTVVIILNVSNRVIGIVVDGVSDVITLTKEQLRPVPEFNSAIASDHLLAIGAVDERMLILVDIEKLMTSHDMGLVEQALQ
ncbi:MAG TPA: chemotaxis protein CheW [Ancylobacter sp.]